MKAVLIPGDGIGPEISASVESISLRQKVAHTSSQ